MSLSTDMAEHKQAALAPTTGAAQNDAVKAAQETVSKVRLDETKDERSVKSSWQNLKDAASEHFSNIRHHAISATPRFLVNNSSNILGAAHVGTEIMMFKASLQNRKLVENPQNPVDYVYRAIKHVYTDAFSKSGTDFEELKAATRGKPVRGFINYIKDTETATKRAVDPQLGKLNDKGELITRANVSLGNVWQTRSTLAGLIAWTLSAVIPDKKESAEEVERMAVLRSTNLPGYIGERLKQAVWVPDWGLHKRQMIGLGIMLSGICSMIGAWRNNVNTVKEIGGVLQKCRVYEFNPSYFATSVLTFISSLSLLFAADDQKGFGGFGAWMTGRLAFLPSSIARKFQGDKVAASYYTGAMVGFQAENWAQALIGGAEKLPDGTIVDHEDAKQRAKLEAEEIKRSRPKRHVFHLPNETPHTQVTSVVSAERAMPERVEAQREAAVAG